MNYKSIFIIRNILSYRYLAGEFWKWTAEQIVSLEKGDVFEYPYMGFKFKNPNNRGMFVQFIILDVLSLYYGLFWRCLR